MPALRAIRRLICRRTCAGDDRGWRLRWAVLATGDVLAAVPRVPAGLRPACPRPAAAHAGLPAGRCASPRSTTTGRRWSWPRSACSTSSASTRPARVLAPRPHIAALVAAAGAAGAAADRRLLLPAGPGVSALDLRGARAAERDVADRLAARLLQAHRRRPRAGACWWSGSNASAAEVVDAIRGQQWLGLDVVGIAEGGRNGSRVPCARRPAGARRDATSCPTLCDRYAIDEVIIASDTSWQDELLDAFSRAPLRARVSVVPSPFEILIGRRETLRLHDIPLIEVMHDAPRGRRLGSPSASSTSSRRPCCWWCSRRCWLLVALAVRLTSAGPVIYRQDARRARRGRRSRSTSSARCTRRRRATPGR